MASVSSPQYDFGMIGLGVMGSNLLLNIADHGFAAIGFDLRPERGAALEAAANPGTTVRGVATLGEMVLSLKTPRKIMMLVPAGKPVDDVLAQLQPYLEPGDIVIDGGNSYFKDTLHRVAAMEESGIHFFGMGVSGGEMGARTGPSMMPGGDKASYEYLRPILEAIAAKADEKPCVAYMGSGAAGHYVKMVHNGIEYAMMQMIAEAYDLLRKGGYTNAELQALFTQWNEGRLESFLIEITADIFGTGDAATPGNDDYLVDNILDRAGAKGTGKWTSMEGMDLPVPIPTIDAAVAARTLSVYKDLRVQAAAQYAYTPTLDVEKEALADAVEESLLFGFVMAYAQGLHMLGKASEVHGMNIPLPQAVQVWRAGCIIRSRLLENFSAAYAKDASLPHILFDAGIQKLVTPAAASARSLVAKAIAAGIPVVCLSSAVGYFDSLLTASLPTNLIQAQRDYFGAHTYQRINGEGVHHTEWSK